MIHAPNKLLIARQNKLDIVRPFQRTCNDYLDDSRAGIGDK